MRRPTMRSKALHQAIATGGEPDSIAVVTGPMLGDAAGLACPTFVPQFNSLLAAHGPRYVTAHQRPPTTPSQIR